MKNLIPAVIVIAIIVILATIIMLQPKAPVNVEPINKDTTHTTTGTDESTINNDISANTIQEQINDEIVEPQQQIKNVDAKIKLLKVLNDAEWIKENASMKTSCFGEPFEGPQVHSYEFLRDDLAVVQAYSYDESFGSQLFFIGYKDDGIQVLSFPDDAPAHPGHGGFGINTEDLVLVYYYGHMDITDYTAYKIDNLSLTEIEKIRFETNEEFNQEQLDSFIEKYKTHQINRDLKFAYFITNSVHATIPGAPGAYNGELYYFDEDGTYYWGASEYYNNQRIVAKMGRWKIKDDALILDTSVQLYLKDGELIEQTDPNDLSKEKLVNYKESLIGGGESSHKINYVGASSYSEGIFEYTIDDKTFYSNVHFDMEDNPWIKRLKELKEKYPFLPGTPGSTASYQLYSDNEYDDNTYLFFESIDEIFITVWDKKNKEQILTMHGTYEVNKNEIQCTIDSFTIVTDNKEVPLNGKLKLLHIDNENYNYHSSYNWELSVTDWSFDIDGVDSAYWQEYFIYSFVNTDDVFCPATI